MNTPFFDPPGIEIDPDAKIITVTQSRFELTAAAIRSGYSHVIYAAEVVIPSDYRNPGCDLTITAARIVTAAGGVALDASGTHGTLPSTLPSVDGVGLIRDLDGADGKTGANGTDGMAGGDIRLRAGRFEGGPITMISRGGNGSAPQNGGNGYRGRTNAKGADAPYPAKVVTGSKTVTVHTRTVSKQVWGWGSDVKLLGEDSFTTASLRMAFKAQSGMRGGNGGNAGLPGTPGASGAGGKLSYAYMRDPRLKIAQTTDRGKPGPAGKAGTPGKGAAGAEGGRFRYMGNIGFVDIGWSFYDSDDRWATHWTGKPHFANLGVGSEFLTSDGRGLRVRAPSGSTGHKGGYGPDALPSPPPAPKGATAATGSSGKVKLSTPGQNRHQPTSYLLQLRQSAHIARINLDPELEQAILEWLLYWTDPQAKCDPNPEPALRERLHQEALHQALTIGRQEDIYAKACVLTDIDKYSDFVDRGLDHLSALADHAKDFSDASAAIANKRASLTGAIDEARALQAHLIGDEATPGSISFFRRREGEIRESIASLDADLFALRFRLDQMPQNLQSAIDKKYAADSAMTLELFFQLASLAVGVVMNLGTALSSVKTLVTEARDFYMDVLQYENWGDVLKEGIWHNTFDQIVAEASFVTEMKSFGKMTKDAQSFAKSAIDFAGKIEAYDKILNRDTDMPVHRIDVQASVLVFDRSKLQLRRQRAKLEADLLPLLEEHKEARTWKEVFENYFHTANSRFENLAALSEFQAKRREAEFQLDLAMANLERLEDDLSRLDWAPTNVDRAAAQQALQSTLALAMQDGLNRVLDQARAYRAWSLKTHALPPLPAAPSVKTLKTQFHEPVWSKIKSGLASWNDGTWQDFKGGRFWIARSQFADESAFQEIHYDTNEDTWRLNFSIPVETGANVYHQRLRDVKAVLKGLRTADGSPVLIRLTHRGVSSFLNDQREVVVTRQAPRSITYSYLNDTGEPDFDYADVLRAEFDKPSGGQRIRYSPYATWEIMLRPDFRLQEGGRLYNNGLDWSAFERIELNYSAFKEVF